MMRVKESSCSTVIPGELKLGVLGVGGTSLVSVLEERVGESKLCEEREDVIRISLLSIMNQHMIDKISNNIREFFRKIDSPEKGC